MAAAAVTPVSLSIAAQVADSCKSQGAAACEIFPFDLVNTGDIDSLAKRILADQQVDVLVNNAGIMVSGSASEGECTFALQQPLSFGQHQLQHEEPDAVLLCCCDSSVPCN